MEEGLVSPTRLLFPPALTEQEKINQENEYQQALQSRKLLSPNGSFQLQSKLSDAFHNPEVALQSERQIESKVTLAYQRQSSQSKLIQQGRQQSQKKFQDLQEEQNTNERVKQSNIDRQLEQHGKFLKNQIDLYNKQREMEIWKMQNDIQQNQFSQSNEETEQSKYDEIQNQNLSNMQQQEQQQVFISYLHESQRVVPTPPQSSPPRIGSRLKYNKGEYQGLKTETDQEYSGIRTPQQDLSPQSQTYPINRDQQFEERVQEITKKELQEDEEVEEEQKVVKKEKYKESRRQSREKVERNKDKLQRLENYEKKMTKAEKRQTKEEKQKDYKEKHKERSEKTRESRKNSRDKKERQQETVENYSKQKQERNDRNEKTTQELEKIVSDIQENYEKKLQQMKKELKQKYKKYKKVSGQPEQKMAFLSEKEEKFQKKTRSLIKEILYKKLGITNREQLKAIIAQSQVSNAEFSSGQTTKQISPVESVANLKKETKSPSMLSCIESLKPFDKLLSFDMDQELNQEESNINSNESFILTLAATPPRPVFKEERATNMLFRLNENSIEFDVIKQFLQREITEITKTYTFQLHQQIESSEYWILLYYHDDQNVLHDIIQSPTGFSPRGTILINSKPHQKEVLITLARIQQCKIENELSIQQFVEQNQVLKYQRRNYQAAYFKKEDLYLVFSGEDLIPCYLVHF